MKKGFSLIEVMVAIAVFTVIVLGTMLFQYHATAFARKADARITASRIALLFLNDWSAKKGAHDYYPISEFNTDFAPNGDFGSKWDIFDGQVGPSGPSGFLDLDPLSYPDYRISINRVNYYVKLLYKDEVDKPRVLNVTVGWRNDYDIGLLDGSSKTVSLTGYAN